MASPEQSALADKLRDGWVVVGFSSNMMAAGALTHSILLQRDDKLIALTVVVNAGRELGRTTISLTG